MTAEISRDPWAVLDELLGVEVAGVVESGVWPVAFQGRCSTEDNQDPETSLGWQLSNARKFVEPLGGTVVAEYFDVGQSRSVPWERRTEAGRLLAALKDRNRGWDAVVVGEGTRCWFGNQFSAMTEQLPGYASIPAEQYVPASAAADLIAQLINGRHDHLHGRFVRPRDDLAALAAALTRHPRARTLGLLTVPGDPLG